MTSTMAEQKCPKCSMPKSRWTENNGQGVTKDGQTYCCAACASGADCTCK